jgi:hypothetical protein
MLLEHQLDEMIPVSTTPLETRHAACGNGLPGPRTIGPWQLPIRSGEHHGAPPDAAVAHGHNRASTNLTPSRPLASEDQQPRRPSTARAFAVRLRDGTAELAGFLDVAELPAELELDIAAHLAAADGLVERAVNAIETAGPG